MKATARVMGRLAAAVAALILTERAVAQQAAPVAAPGQQITRRLVINIPAMTLELFENNEHVRTYRIAVGRRSTPSPVGAFRVASLVKNPTWYGPNGQVVVPGSNNPVGTRWIGLDKKGYGIHGTNAPNSIGRAASHGCIRMRNGDVEELFARVRVGDEVEIVYETVMADGTVLNDVYGLADTTASASASAGGGM